MNNGCYTHTRCVCVFCVLSEIACVRVRVCVFKYVVCVWWLCVVLFLMRRVTWTKKKNNPRRTKHTWNKKEREERRGQNTPTIIQITEEKKKKDKISKKIEEKEKNYLAK